MERGRVRETFELNQLKSAPAQLLPVFSEFESLTGCKLVPFIWEDDMYPPTSVCRVSDLGWGQPSREILAPARDFYEPD